MLGSILFLRSKKPHQRVQIAPLQFGKDSLFDLDPVAIAVLVIIM